MIKTAENILSDFNNKINYKKEMADQTAEVLEGLLSSITFQNGAARDYERVKAGMVPIGNIPNYLLRLGFVLSNFDKSYSTNVRESLLKYCTSMLDEYKRNNDPQLLTSYFAEIVPVPILTDIARELRMNQSIIIFA